eukprot:CAMPEP_0176039084 /NCGR_PEP_ID=MMETSP0120_2-20121206/19373_1 /TAXON_ID=160619 /ORGANISM="Kryptoperidinium foliaceum, Strain CCMP 1326" /LENGTH=366 /DNA_ID=CAMNT_0017372479 /DNA_START=57 /DNA_END=1157 /DNA_ORIENTATION=+
MGERLMTELFFQHKPNVAGELEDQDIARLNRILANVYEQALEESETPLPPPEPLPRGQPLRFAAFRSHVHRALGGLATDWEAKERYLERLIADVRRADGRDDIVVTRRADDEGTAASEPVRSQAPPEPEKIKKQALCGPPTLLGDRGLDDLADALGEGPAAEAARSALLSSRRYGAMAVDLAREYGESFSAIVNSESFRERRLAGQAAAAALLSKVAPQQALRCEPRAQEDDVVEDSIDHAAFPDEPIVGDSPAGFSGDSFGIQQEASFDDLAQISFAGTPPDYTGGNKEHEAFWMFNAGDGKHIDVRTHPDIGAPRAGGKVAPGERFAVSCELRGSDGVLYLQLADGRGWLFDHKPGYGQMCVRA